MKKVIALLIIIFASTLLLSGCFEQENITATDRFVGKWTTEDSVIEQFIFFENGSCLIKVYGLEATYNVSEEDRIIVIYQKDHSETYEYEYRFGNNYRKLTLTNTNTFEAWIFRKQEE